MAENNTASVANPTVAFAGSAVVVSLWFAALIAMPALQNSDLAVIAEHAALHLILLGGVWAGLSRTGLTAPERMRTWLAIAIPFTVWHGAAWAIVAKGLIVAGAIAIPLLPLMIVVPTTVTITLLLRSRRVGALLDAMPASWLVGVQVYRLIGVAFLADWLAGTAPSVFAIPAGTGDILTGLLALPAAIGLASGRPGSARAALLWNLLGIADLLLAIALGALTTPGPLQSLALDHPNLTTGAYPIAIIPAFTVPMSLVLHALSLRQLRKRRRATTALPREA